LYTHSLSFALPTYTTLPQIHNENGQHAHPYHAFWHPTGNPTQRCVFAANSDALFLGSAYGYFYHLDPCGIYRGAGVIVCRFKDGAKENAVDFYDEDIAGTKMARAKTSVPLKRQSGMQHSISSISVSFKDF
jgi:hypothetical protein